MDEPDIARRIADQLAAKAFKGRESRMIIVALLTEQCIGIRVLLLERGAVDTGNTPCDQPTCQAHLDHGYQGGSFVEGGMGTA